VDALVLGSGTVHAAKNHGVPIRILQLVSSDVQPADGRANGDDLHAGDGVVVGVDPDTAETRDRHQTRMKQFSK
jgi:hypothetical protein